MRKFIENTKEDIAKLKRGFTKTKEKAFAKVIPPEGTVKGTTESVEENIQQEQEPPQEQEQGQIQPQVGEIIKYATEMVFEVIDEEGNRIQCKTMAEAEILSRMIELRLFFVKQE